MQAPSRAVSSVSTASFAAFSKVSKTVTELPGAASTLTRLRLYSPSPFTVSLALSAVISSSGSSAVLSSSQSMAASFTFLPVQPMLPFISRRMRLFISTAYSTGSSLETLSAKPLTIIALASSSLMPRLIR